jgi:hypothetical protein
MNFTDLSTLLSNLSISSCRGGTCLSRRSQRRSRVPALYRPHSRDTATGTAFTGTLQVQRQRTAPEAGVQMTGATSGAAFRHSEAACLRTGSSGAVADERHRPGPPLVAVSGRYSCGFWRGQGRACGIPNSELTNLRALHPASYAPSLKLRAPSLEPHASPTGSTMAPAKRRLDSSDG